MGMSKELLKGLLDNPNFKKWFGESAVRDAEGLPLEVYHGTRRDFTAFDPTKNGTAHDSGFHGDGFYFAKTGDHASDYAGRVDGASVVPGFISIENPYIKPSRRKHGPDAKSLYQADIDRMGGISVSARDDPKAYAEELTALLKKNGHDGLVLDTGNPNYDEIVAFDPTQFKSRFNQGTFDPTDPNFLKSAGLMTAGAGAAAYGMSPDEAEAGKLPWKADAKAQLLSQIFEGLRAGKVQPQVFEDLAGLNGGFKLPEYLMMGGDLRHVFERRMMDNGWSADRVVAALDTLFGSEDARGVPNLIGRKASEAVWSPGKPRGVYAPAIPGPDGEVRIYSLMDPENKRILRGLGKLEEGSSGGRMSPPFTQTADFPSSESVTQRHRAKLSAVDEPSPDKDQIMPDANTVKKILGLGLLGGAGLGAYDAATPDDANAMSYIGPKGLANFLGPEKAKALLSEAEQLAAKGLDNEAVRQATGVFKGMDGKWRYELDDSGAQFLENKLPYQDSLTKHWSTIGESFGHPNLLKSHPDLADETLIVNPNLNSAGEYSSMKGALNQGISIRGEMTGGGEIPGSKGWDHYPSEIDLSGSKGTLLHELQHAIQQREGFARGGSPSTAHVTRDLSEITPLVPQERASGGSTSTGPILVADDEGKLIITDGNHRYWDAVNRGDKTIDTLFDPSFFDGNNWSLEKAIKNAPQENYQRLAGEIEARDTAARMNLTPEQRRATPPDLRDNAIVRFDQNGPNEAAGLMGYNAPPRFSVDPKRVAAEALQDAYSPIDTAIAVLTGGGGLASRAIQAAVDPFMEYVPKIADAINPRNIITGLMR